MDELRCWFFCRNLTTTATPTMPSTTSTAESSSEKGNERLRLHPIDSQFVMILPKYLHYYELIINPLFSLRITIEHARGPRRRDRDGGRGGRRSWIDKYGPPTRTNYRVIVENLSSRVSWQVSSAINISVHAPFLQRLRGLRI